MGIVYNVKVGTGYDNSEVPCRKVVSQRRVAKASTRWNVQIPKALTHQSVRRLKRLGVQIRGGIFKT